MRSEETFIVWSVIGLLLLFVSIIALAIFDARMESATFNRLTGAHTTTWDAMFVELRVMESPKK